MNTIETEIKVPRKEDVPQESGKIFERLTRTIGKVPNMYAVIGYSPYALKALLTFEETLSHGSFTAAEREAIYLAVSEVNGCQYCLAAHSAIALSLSYSEEQIIEIRRGHTNDEKLSAILSLAIAITQNRGAVDTVLVQHFYQVGYNEAALMELIALVTSKVFTNYVFAVTPFPIDFPKAKDVDFEQ